MHQYRVHIIYKPDPDLYMMEWLSHNSHAKIRDHKIAGMCVNVNAITTSVTMPVCTSKEDIKAAIHDKPAGTESVYNTWFYHTRSQKWITA